MSTYKPVVGFDDNLASRFQEYAPTLYAIGKLRAARTPYNRDNVVVNDANQILRPGLYLMELNNASQNTAGMQGGVLFLYQLSADPDESLHGGHVDGLTPSNATMNVRQIGYFHNGSVNRVMTRVGTPLNNYGNVTVKHLSDIASGTEGITFVKELGMWVHHHTVNNNFVIELAVTWSDWTEFGSGSGEGDYTFLTTMTNGVGLQNPDTNVWQAVGQKADKDNIGTVIALEEIVSVSDSSYKYKVPDVNAVYNAVSTINASAVTVSSTAATASTTASQAQNSVVLVSSVLNDHITNNHPSAVSHADYNNLTKSLGTVFTTPSIASINSNIESAKYTVPTVNAVYNASSALSGSIMEVSRVLSEHIATSDALIDSVATPLYISNNGDSNILAFSYETTATAGAQLYLKQIDDTNQSSLAVKGIPAQTDTFGVVKAESDIVSYSHTMVEDYPVSGYIDEFTVPTMNAVYNASSNLNASALAIDTCLVLVSSVLSDHIENHPSGGGGIPIPNYVTPSTWGWDTTEAHGNIAYQGTAGPNGGYLMISIVLPENHTGCVGAIIGENYVHLVGANTGAMSITKILPVPANEPVYVYDGGQGATVKACGYGVTGQNS